MDLTNPMDPTYYAQADVLERLLYHEFNCLGTIPFSNASIKPA